MTKQYRTTETEIIAGEDWCTHCEKDVAAWVVFIETDSEGEYAKIRRCPHCNKKSLKDSSFPIAALFFVLGFLSAAIWFVLPWAFGIRITEEVLFIILGAGVLHGLLVMVFADHSRKKFLYRKRDQTSKPNSGSQNTQPYSTPYGEVDLD